MKKLAKLLDERTITQAALAVLIWGACIYLVVVGQPVPELLSNAALIAFGYFFGVTTQQAISNALKGK